MGPIEPLIGPRPYGEQGVPSELELKLKKIGIPVSHYQIITHPNLFGVAEILKKRFKYEGVEMENLHDSGGPKGQMDRILELSGIENITNTLEALAKSGYKLENEWKGLQHVPCILKEDVRVIKNISLSLEAYLRTLEKIKKSLGIRNANYTHSHASDILSIASLKDEHWTCVDALCKCGYISFSYYNLFNESYLLEKIAKFDTRKFLDVFNVLKKRFGYKSVDMENISGAGGPKGQVERILELSSLEGICDALRALADSGYKLPKEWKGLQHVPCIREDDVRIIESVASLGIDKFLKTFKKIKDCLDIRNIIYSSYNAFDILTLTNLEGKYWTGVEALCKCDYISFSYYKLFEDIHFIKKVTNSDTKKFLDIFNVLKKRFGYNSVDMENLHGAGNSIGQVERILELSNMEGVCEIFDILADTGYKLDTEWKGLQHVPCILTKNMEDIKKLVKGKLYKTEYSQLITKLENQLGYKNIKKDYTQLLHLADFFSKFRSDICEKTIDLLPVNFRTFKYNSNRLTEEDISEMKKVAYKLWEKELDNIKLENKCLYKENTQGFIELFSSLKETEQKTVIKSILSCDHYNKEIADWLDKNYPNLIREVGLSP